MKSHDGLAGSLGLGCGCVKRRLRSRCRKCTVCQAREGRKEKREDNAETPRPSRGQAPCAEDRRDGPRSRGGRRAGTSSELVAWGRWVAKYASGMSTFHLPSVRNLPRPGREEPGDLTDSPVTLLVS